MLIALALICSIALTAFLPIHVNHDFLNQLGISKSEADSRIIKSFLSGYFDSSRATRLKNLSLGDRRAVLNDVLGYTKNFVSSNEFKDAYQKLRSEQMPKKPSIQSPDEMQAAMIAALKKSVEMNEESLKKADASLKPIFEETLASTKQMLAEAQDPDNDQLSAYRESYNSMVEMNEQVYQNQLEEWNQKYPENQNDYVKGRLQEFIDLADDIDYSATLVAKDGKQVFQKPEYENKDYRWKLGYRTGKELMEVAEGFAKAWINELK